MFSVVPMLRVQRELYEIPHGWDRFKRYLAAMTGGTDDLILPLQAMNPMGKAPVAEALDALIAARCRRSRYGSRHHLRRTATPDQWKRTFELVS